MAVTAISIPGGFDDGVNGVRTMIKIGDNIKATAITSITAVSNTSTGRPIYYLMGGDVQLAQIFDSNGVTF